MKTCLLLAFALMTSHTHAATGCLSFIKDWQGRNKAVFRTAIITEPEKELGSYDGITIKVRPERKDFSKISVFLINDGREQLMVGETVWLSAEILSRSNEAYWVLIDCAPAGAGPQSGRPAGIRTRSRTSHSL